MAGRGEGQISYCPESGTANSASNTGCRLGEQQVAEESSSNEQNGQSGDSSSLQIAAQSTMLLSSLPLCTAERTLSSSCDFVQCRGSPRGNVRPARKNERSTESRASLTLDSSHCRAACVSCADINVRLCCPTARAVEVRSVSLRMPLLYDGPSGRRWTMSAQTVYSVATRRVSANLLEGNGRYRPCASRRCEATCPWQRAQRERTPRSIANQGPAERCRRSRSCTATSYVEDRQMSMEWQERTDGRTSPRCVYMAAAVAVPHRGMRQGHAVTNPTNVGTCKPATLTGGEARALLRGL